MRFAQHACGGPTRPWALPPALQPSMRVRHIVKNVQLCLTHRGYAPRCGMRHGVGMAGGAADAA